MIERFRQLQPNPVLQPGTHFAYNNAGYVLLAEVLSRILSQPMTDIASTHLFTPLALTHTRLGGHPVRLPAIPDPPRTIGDGGLWISKTARIPERGVAVAILSSGGSELAISDTGTNLAKSLHPPSRSACGTMGGPAWYELSASRARRKRSCRVATE